MAGGLLRAIASFAPVAVGSDATRESLYLAIDVCLALGVATFCASLSKLADWRASAGFGIALAGIAIIRMNRRISVVDLYPAGALGVAIGVLMLSVSGWRAGRLRAWVPGAFVLSPALGIAGTVLPDAGFLFVGSGVLFGIAFVALGAAAWSATSR